MTETLRLVHVRMDQLVESRRRAAFSYHDVVEYEALVDLETVLVATAS